MEPDIYLDTLLIITISTNTQQQTRVKKKKQKIKRNDHWTEISAYIRAFINYSTADLLWKVAICEKCSTSISPAKMFKAKASD